MKMIDGARLRASSKSLRILAAPSPTNISTKADALWEKKRAPDSPATPFASSVLPVPGGPYRRMPFGTLAPSCSNRFGSLRKSITSCSSAFASVTPATSSRLTDSREPGSTCVGLTRGITESVRQSR